ncbi:MAG: GNAT family N-acetyltransferase [Dehalococcoidia bacterium]|nr:GNAT family N-acetyltransferase [Dehalococcoidia bacterium]
MGEIVKLSELGDKQLNQVVDVFVEGFYIPTLKRITKDKEKLRRLFINAFDGDMSYAYLHDGNVVGFMGLADDRKRPMRLDEKTYIEEFGSFSGKMVYKQLIATMENIKVHSPDEICIDYITTHPEHRSMGIGKKMIEYVRDNMGYKYIWLEVLSKNPRGIAFYEREGFKQGIVKTNFFLNLLAMVMGYGKLITMRMEAGSKQQ